MKNKLIQELIRRGDHRVKALFGRPDDGPSGSPAVQDIVDDALVKMLAVEARGKLPSDDDAVIRLWYVIVKRTAIDWYRHRKIVWRWSDELAHYDREDDDGEITDALEMLKIAPNDKVPDTPEAAHDRATDRDNIQRALDQLSAQQRDAFVWRHVRGYSTKETAKIMRIKKGTVKIHLSRARRALTKILDDERERFVAAQRPPTYYNALELDRALDQLSEQQRTAFILRHLCDVTDTDASAMMNIEQSTLRVHDHRAYNRILDILRDNRK